MRLYGIKGYPHMIFMDKNGYILDRIPGFVNEQVLSARMKSTYGKRFLEDKLKKELAKVKQEYFENSGQFCWRFESN